MAKQLTKTGKGRSTRLIILRNHKLVYRYYYYTEIKGLRYDYAITALSGEFFISERTIADILRENNPMLSGIFNKKPSVDLITRKCTPFICEIDLREKERYLNK